MILKTASLSPSVLQIVQRKGTELPFSGEYEKNNLLGTYLCRQCGLALFRADNKFDASCGWPSFDDEITGNILCQLDQDGLRTEILCLRCQAHLGHLFKGEGFTKKNARYCVNSLSLDFITATNIQDTAECIFAAGCFWGVEYYFQQLMGVLKTEVGYIGGTLTTPSYEQVCRGNTGHYEAVRIIYDPLQLSYTELVKYFFNIHNPSQSTGQGPDIGSQYLSRIFYYDHEQETIAIELIKELENLSYNVNTKVLPMAVFWRAENYHQHYYQNKATLPYCHRYEKKF